jgi:hypothetical protein
MLSARITATSQLPGNFLGTVHAMQRQHTSGRKLFMNEEIVTELLAQV